MRIPGYCSDRVPVEGGEKGGRGGVRPGAAPARPVPDREVAGAPCRLGAVDRPRHLDVRGLGRGGEPGRALVGRAECTSADGAHAGHPLRHPLVEVRHDLRGDPLARARAARAAEAERALRDRARRAGVHVERADLVPPRRARTPRDARRWRAAQRRARLPASARDPREVLLEEREVAPRDRALGGRQAGILGAVRLPQRRGSVRGAALRLLAPPWITRSSDYSEGNRRRYLGYPPPPSLTPRRPGPHRVFSFARTRTLGSRRFG